MREMLAKYKRLDAFIIDVLMAEFFLQMVSASFTLLINFYIQEQGYQDYRVGDLVSYRFLAVMIFAFPFGLFIKGRKLKSYFFIAAIGSPIMALIVIFAISHHILWLIYAGFVGWGVAYTCLQVTSLPFIILNSDKERHPQAIALFFLTSSMAMFIGGGISSFLNHYFSHFFNVKVLLEMFAITGFAGVYFISRIKVKENLSEKSTMRTIHSSYDWKLIVPVVVPAFIISAGAGLTIQFVNLFFKNVHHMNEDTYAFIGSFSFLLVAFGNFLVPEIKNRFGYNIAIVFIQSLAVLFLIFLAMTEFIAGSPSAVWLAAFFFIVRQPLMNVAGPMATELTISYVGKRNQELVSSLNAAIISGCWYMSSQLFSILRGHGLRYAYIFFITAFLYALGVLWYYFLIKDFHRRKSQGLIVD